MIMRCEKTRYLLNWNLRCGINIKVKQEECNTTSISAGAKTRRRLSQYESACIHIYLAIVL